MTLYHLIFVLYADVTFLYRVMLFIGVFHFICSTMIKCINYGNGQVSVASEVIVAKVTLIESNIEGSETKVLQPPFLGLAT